MTATLRFGLPGPSDAEQVVLNARWGGDAAPVAGEALRSFPYAIGVTSTALTATVRNVGGAGNTTFTTLTDAGIQHLLYHPDSGLIPNGITHVALFNSGYDAYEETGEWAKKVHEQSHGRVRVIAGLDRDLDGATWYGKASVPGDTDTPLAAALTDPLAYYADIPGVIAYITADDLNNTTLLRDLNNPVIRWIQANDVAHRPASASYLGNGSNTIAGLGSDAKIALVGGGGYPSRWISTGVKRAEGDFTHANDGTTDWWQWVRAFAVDYPDTHIWHWLQAHQLGDGSTTSLHLSYPTAAEIRKQTWEAVGSGAKGILWFIWDDDSAGSNWVGLAHPDSRDRMAAVAEMGKRLTPNIRKRLLSCAPTANNDEFTATGGGSADWQYQDYTDAYISTLQDSSRGEYLVVVCNRATTTQSVTIGSATMLGNLINLENGTTIAVGGSVSLGPLDGTIFRFVADANEYGVPNIVFTSHSKTQEEYWEEHWMNPASVNYLAPGAILTHPNVVNVPNGNDLQAAIDAAPDYTTFVLEAGGTYSFIDLVGRNGMHFICDDPDSDDPDLETNWPICYGVNIFGHERAREYHWNDGWVAALIEPDRDGDFDAPLQDLTAIAAFISPPRDYLFRHIHFTQEPGTTVDQYYLDRPDQGGVKFMNPKNAPFYASGARQILFEYCKWDGYVHSDGTGDPEGTQILDSHPGFLYASGGVEGIFIRNCKTDSSASTVQWYYTVYFDGPMDCVLYNNDFSTGGYRSGAFLTLTNWDVRNDYDQNGSNMGFREWRQPKYFAAVNNQLPSVRLVWTCRNPKNCLIAENTWVYSGTRHCFAEIEVERGNGGGAEADIALGMTGDVTIRDNACSGGKVGDTSLTGFVELKLASGTMTSLYVTDNIIGGGASNTAPNGWVTKVGSTDAGDPTTLVVTGNLDGQA